LNNKFELGISHDHFRFGIPYERSTTKSVGVDFELFKMESSRVDFGSESTHQDSIPKFVRANFGIEVIMISYVFIQTNELRLKGQKSIYIFKTICTTGIKFRHSNFSIKEGNVHLVFPLFCQYCYVVKKIIKFFLVKTRGNISKEMVEKIKRRESLEFELGGNQAALEFDHKTERERKWL